jgi:putative tryptophan/tyrosine transport system substrate-binding protein
MSALTRITGRAPIHLMVVCAVLLAAAGGALGQDPGGVAVVTSRDDGPYEGVVSGVRAALGPRRAVQLHSLESDPEGTAKAIRKARRVAGTPLITVGSSATRAALETPGDAPVIACMIGDRHDLGDAANATGVMLEFPLEVQLKWVRRFLPKSQSIGVLYNPAENKERMVEVERIAERLGLRVVAREVERPQDLPGALESLAGEADVLFAITDQMVLSPQTARAILLFSFRNRMPFTGLSASWVKAGALYALERDYQDLGAQCAEMAVKVLDGARVDSLPPAMPRKVSYALNVRTAEHLKLRLPADLVDGATEVFR